MLRNILVVTQFASAIFLIIATTFALRQLNFMKNRATGFDREQVVNIPLNQGTDRKYDLLKKELLQNSLVSGVTASQDILGSHLDQSGIEFKGDGPMRELTSTRLIVDADYLNLYKIQLAEGRNFSPDSSANGREYIINESLAKELLKDNTKADFSSLIGKHFGFDSIGQIVGVAKDFNFNSLHHKIETMFMFNQTQWGLSTASVKINGKAVEVNAPGDSYIRLENKWKQGDVVEVKLPMKLAIREWTKNKNSVSINYGALTFSLKIDESYKLMDSKASAIGDSKWQPNADQTKWPSYEIYPASMWNYGLALNERPLADQFEITRRPWPKNNFPFTQDDVPVLLKAKGKIIPSWTLDRYGLCAVLPQSPVIVDTKERTIELIPMGAARLRISSFPVVK